MNYGDLQKVVLTISGDSENGYNVVRIRIREDGSRHYSSLYHDMSYANCVEWHNAYAAKNGFIFNKDADICEKTA